MSSPDKKLKKVVIDTFVKSGINVSPEILDIFLEMGEKNHAIELIIKEVSFLPDFNSHLTLEVLKKLQNEEIQRALKRRVYNEKQVEKQPLNLTGNDDLVEPPKNLVLKTPSVNQEVESRPKSESISIEESQPLKSESSIDDKSVEIDTILEEKKKIKIEKKILESKSLSGCSKSVFAFNPIAKDYDFKYEILKDPTGKLYTNGDYDDFYDLTLDKFNTLRSLMRKRPDVSSANNVKNIFRITRKVDVSVIGLVDEIRLTKNGNYLLTVEDLSGSIKILLRKDTENVDSIKLIERTVEDQMIFVEGVYNPGQQNRKGLIYANNIVKIDLPLDHQPNRSQDPVSLALVSDTHMGSKEFEEKLWKRFIKILNGKIGNNSLRNRIGKVKYLIINGDLVDGIGVYPDQKADLLISDIYQQYKYATELLSQIPSYIQIFYSPGNHEPVRNAIPRPAVPSKYSKDLIDVGIKCVGNPSYIQTHDVSTLVYHGDSLLDMNMLIPGLENDKPAESMKELLICRHLAPVYGKKTQIAPVKKDWLIIDKIPDIFHTGHLHINGYGQYRNVSLVNSGCFQAQTDFMRSMGITPTPGMVPIVDLDSFKYLELNLKEIA